MRHLTSVVPLVRRHWQWSGDHHAIEAQPARGDYPQISLNTHLFEFCAKGRDFSLPLRKEAVPNFSHARRTVGQMAWFCPLVCWCLILSAPVSIVLMSQWWRINDDSPSTCEFGAEMKEKTPTSTVEPRGMFGYLKATAQLDYALARRVICRAKK